MGKWVQVRCRCELHTRVSTLPFKCVHQDGALIAFWPGAIHVLSDAVRSAFRSEPEQFSILRRIGDPEEYENEYLAFESDEVELLAMELGELEQFLAGNRTFGYHADRKLRGQLESVCEAHSGLYGSNPMEWLQNAQRLVKAARETSSPIEFEW